MTRMLYVFIGMILTILTIGCIAPQSLKRVAAHNVRDATAAHKENPTDTTKRLVIGTMAVADWTGEPKELVKVEQHEQDVKELRATSKGLDWLFGKAPWLKTVLGILGSLGGLGTAIYTGNYILAARRVIGVLTGAIEKKGNKEVKGQVAKDTKGSKIVNMLSRWIGRAETLHKAA